MLIAMHAQPIFTWSCTSSGCSWICSLPTVCPTNRKTSKYSCYVTNCASYSAGFLGPLVSRIGRRAYLPCSLLAARFTALTKSTGKRLDECMLLFKPDTVLHWHRDLIRRKWTFRRVGRPPVVPELQELIVRLSAENPRWGYGKIQVGVTARSRLGLRQDPGWGYGKIQVGVTARSRENC